MTFAGSPPIPPARAHHLDVARAALMLLGIPYHAAMPYRAGQVWITGPVPGGRGFATVAEAIHLFRMPAFFLVAGWFAALLLARRDPGDWLRGRVVRLGVPLLAALVTLVPLLNLLCEWPQRAWPAAWASFLRESGRSPGYWIRHLWFLIVLLQLSALTVLAMRRWPRLRTATLRADHDAALARRPALWVAVAAVAVAAWQAGTIEGFYAIGMANRLWQQALRLDDLLMAAPWFALGLVLARAPAAMAAFERVGWGMALAALAAVALRLATVDLLHPAAARAVSAVAALLVARLLLAAAKRWLDRPSRLVERLVAASFVIYLFHMPVAVGLVDLAAAAGIAPWPGFALVCVATLALCWGIWTVVRRVPVLRLLYDGRPMRRGSSSPPAPLT